MAQRQENTGIQQRAITQLVKKTEKMFEEIEDERKRELVRALVQEWAFVKLVLKRAKDEMKKDGITTTTKNAQQKFLKQHPAVQTYSTYSKHFSTLTDQLVSYLPIKKEEKKSKLQELRDM